MANIFKACMNLTNKDKFKTYFNNVSNVDTHMTKNVEWGAVDYLAHSKYGLNGKEIEINSNMSFKTGFGSDGSSIYVLACYKTDSTVKLTEKSDYVNKYIDVYDEYGLLKYGDAVFETSFSSSGLSSWFSDFSGFAPADRPIFIRGGDNYSGSGAGLFSFGYSDGSEGGNDGFRPVCIVK